MATAKNLPATGNENNTPAQAGHIPKKGGYYSVAPGKFEADAWKVQEEANEAGISTEFIKQEQTNDHALVIVRAYSKDRSYYVEGVVNHDFEVIQNKKLIEMLKKEIGGKNITFGPNGRKKRIKVFADPREPFITTEQGKTIPNLTPEGTVKILDDMFQFKDISIRDATSKAMRIAQLKLLNKDWREKAEIQAEKDEVNAVNDGKEVPHVDQEVVDKQTAPKKDNIEEKKGEKPTGKPNKSKKVAEVSSEALKEVFKLSPKLEEVFQPVVDDGEPVPKPNLLRKADEFHATENLDLFKQIKEIVKAK